MGYKSYHKIDMLVKNRDIWYTFLLLFMRALSNASIKPFEPGATELLQIMFPFTIVPRDKKNDTHSSLLIR